MNCPFLYKRRTRVNDGRALFSVPRSEGKNALVNMNERRKKFENEIKNTLPHVRCSVTITLSRAFPGNRVHTPIRVAMYKMTVTVDFLKIVFVLKSITVRGSV